MSEALQLPVIDLSSEDRLSTANSIRQACVDLGFFYLVNHGVEEELLKKVFEQSKKIFSLPVEEKIKFPRKNHSGYTGLYDEKLDTSLSAKGDPFWLVESRSAGKQLVSLIALALNLDEDFFQKLGAMNEPLTFLRLLHYPGNVDSSREEVCGASAHSDYGIITLLLTDGVPGLQICREKSKQPQVWEDVPSMSGAFIVNIADMMEMWTNGLFRSTLHRVLSPGQDRYSVMIRPLLFTSFLLSHVIKSQVGGILHKSQQRLHSGMLGMLLQ